MSVGTTWSLHNMSYDLLIVLAVYYGMFRPVIFP